LKKGRVPFNEGFHPADNQKATHPAQALDGLHGSRK